MKYHQQLMNAILYDKVDLSAAVNVDRIKRSAQLALPPPPTPITVTSVLASSASGCVTAVSTETTPPLAAPVPVRSGLVLPPMPDRPKTIESVLTFWAPGRAP